MRALLASVSLLVLVGGCGSETSPATAPASASASCEQYAQVVGGKDPQGLAELAAGADLTAAEQEGLRLLTEPGLGPPQGPQQEQAVLAFAGYVGDLCPDLEDDVTAALDLAVDPVGGPTEAPEPTDPTELIEPTEPDPFCASWSALPADNDPGPQVRALQEWFVEVDRDGLDADLPPDVRAGLVVLEDLVAPLDPDTVTEGDLVRLERQATREQERQVETFGDWVDATCGF